MNYFFGVSLPLAESFVQSLVNFFCNFSCCHSFFGVRVLFDTKFCNSQKGGGPQVTWLYFYFSFVLFF